MNKEILIKAIETYGPENQLSQATEECAEFIQAVNKWRRAKEAEECVAALVHLGEEIADCMIMMEQAKIVVTEELVDRWIEEKLKRLAKNLEAQNG